MRWLCALALLLAACASAGGGSGNPADGPAGEDAQLGDAMPPDTMPPVDGPPVAQILSQSVSTVPSSANMGCQLDNRTLGNNFYRVFRLADHGITGSYEVRSVTFAVALADANGTQQPGKIKIGRYTGTPDGLTLDLAAIVPITEVSIQIPDGAASVTTPISGVIPPGGQLIAELENPVGYNQGHRFFAGGNTAGEVKRGYWRSANCNVNVPTSTNYVRQQEGGPKFDLIMTVDGVKY